MTKAVAEIQKRKDYSAALESDLQQYRNLEDDFENLKNAYEKEKQKNGDLTGVGFAVIGGPERAAEEGPREPGRERAPAQVSGRTREVENRYTVSLRRLGAEARVAHDRV